MRPSQEELERAVATLAAAQHYDNGLITRLIRMARDAGLSGTWNYDEDDFVGHGVWCSENKDIVIHAHPSVLLTWKAVQRWQVSAELPSPFIDIFGAMFSMDSEDYRWRFQGNSRETKEMDLSCFAEYPHLVTAVLQYWETRDLPDYTLSHNTFLRLFRSCLAWRQQRQNG